MKISTILPNLRIQPGGGYRVHYEYANRLAARGHDVSIIHYVASARRRLRARLLGTRRVVSWFEFDPRVSLHVTPHFSIPQVDVGILTSWSTAELSEAFRGQASVLVQVVYDYEFWMTADPETRARMAYAFRIPDVSIATSHAVATMLRDAGRRPDAIIPCAIDHDAFGLDINPGDRPPTIGMIVRPQGYKRTVDAIRALERLRTTRVFRVIAVGWQQQALPEWIETWDAPNDEAMRAFYNHLGVFVLPSEYEGWGLPAAEAMACGAAVVTTRSGGVEDFAVHGKNALLVPPRDLDALCHAVASLLDDHELRLRIAHGGLTSARQMSWDRAVDALETLLAPDE
jgi:glycosyltransferase involved in cell wall biosynthesis